MLRLPIKIPDGFLVLPYSEEARPGDLYYNLIDIFLKPGEEPKTVVWKEYLNPLDKTVRDKSSSITNTVVIRKND